MRTRSNIGPYILIGLGSYFLLTKLGWMPSLGPLIAEWWPVILIIIGVSMLLKRSDSDQGQGPPAPRQ